MKDQNNKPITEEEFMKGESAGVEIPKTYTKTVFIKELETHTARIFEILNCYEVDARNITNGMTYLDSRDAEKLARNIIHSIQENL